MRSYRGLLLLLLEVAWSSIIFHHLPWSLFPYLNSCTFFSYSSCCIITVLPASLSFSFVRSALLQLTFICLFSGAYLHFSSFSSTSYRPFLQIAMPSTNIIVRDTPVCPYLSTCSSPRQRQVLDGVPLPPEKHLQSPLHTSAPYHLIHVLYHPNVLFCHSRPPHASTHLLLWPSVLIPLVPFDSWISFCGAISDQPQWN